jgi:serine/threonine protein kinase
LPKARCDLDVYMSHTHPVFDDTLIVWILRQLSGIASALNLIHTGLKEGSSSSFKQSSPSGLHGDIKPSNILIFDDSVIESQPSSSSHGRMVLSDFGLSSFGRVDRVASSNSLTSAKLDARDIRSRTQGIHYILADRQYIAPETEIRRERTAASDIWSLGCVMVEMLVWLSYGKTGQREFLLDLSSGGHNGGPLWMTTTTSKVELKPAVCDWISRLWATATNHTLLYLLVDLLQTSHILDPEPTKRTSAAILYERLKKLSQYPVIERPDSGTGENKFELQFVAKEPETRRPPEKTIRIANFNRTQIAKYKVVEAPKSPSSGELAQTEAHGRASKTPAPTSENTIDEARDQLSILQTENEDSHCASLPTSEEAESCPTQLIASELQRQSQNLLVPDHKDASPIKESIEQSEVRCSVPGSSSDPEIFASRDSFSPDRFVFETNSKASKLENIVKDFAGRILPIAPNTSLGDDKLLELPNFPATRSGTGSPRPLSPRARSPSDLTRPTSRSPWRIETKPRKRSRSESRLRSGNGKVTKLGARHAVPRLRSGGVNRSDSFVGSDFERNLRNGSLNIHL